MKKLIAAGIMAALALAACGVFLSQVDEDTDGVPSVQYSMDGKSLTLRLDGKGGVDKNEARALSYDQAIGGQEFYEVVFHAATGTARASWERGEAAAIKNVVRGIDYGAADITAVAGTVGAATLFVGRKSDKTLLAIGLLTAVDDGPGTTVSTATTRVTFSVGALKANYTDLLLATTSTASHTGTMSTVTVPVQGKVAPVPVHLVPRDLTTQASNTYNTTWTLDVVDSSDITIGTAVAHLKGIVVAPAFSTAKPLHFSPPRIPVGGVDKYLSPHTSNATAYLGTMTAGASIPAAIPIKIETGTEEGFTSLIVEVPVVAITDTISSDGNNKALTWYVRSGFGRNLLDLEDGSPNPAGGAMLLAIGTTPPPSILLVDVLEP